MIDKDFNAKKIGKEISPLVFGCANDFINGGNNSNHLFDKAFELGINTFDTARQYGLSENVVGNWLKTKNREDIVLITKCSHPEGDIQRVTPEDIDYDMEKSLEALGTDYVDIYLLHRDDFNVEVGPIVEKMNELMEAGKIKVFGGSNWTIRRIKEANDYAAKHGLQPFTVSSPNFSLGNQIGEPWGGGEGSVTLSGAERKADREWYRKENFLLFGYSSLAHGFFSGRLTSANLDKMDKVIDRFAMSGFNFPENIERLKRAEELAKQKGCTIPQLVLAWIIQQKEVKVYPIVSSTNPERIESNMKALQLKLSPEEIRYVNLES